MTEIPTGHTGPIPALSTVQPCDRDRQGMISVLRDGHSSPGRGPPQPALPLKLALLSAGASRGTIQTKPYCDFCDNAGSGSRGRGAILGDTREFQ